MPPTIGLKVRPRFVVQREVRADRLPGGAAVGRLMDVLAADVDPVVVVRRDRQRERPYETVLQIRGRPADRGARPDLYATGGVGARVVTGDDPDDAAEARRARPHDGRVLGVGGRPAALAAADAHPHAARDVGLIILDAERAAARATSPRPVLAVAVSP